MVGKPVELVVDGVNGLVDIAVAEERTLLAGRGGLVILIFQVECVPFGRSGHPDGGIALTHEDVVVARQVVIADQDDAAPALIFADRTGGLTGNSAPVDPSTVPPNTPLSLIHSLPTSTSAFQGPSVNPRPAAGLPFRHAAVQTLQPQNGGQHPSQGETA